VGRSNGVVFSVLLLAFSYIVSGNDGLMSLMICSRRAGGAAPLLLFRLVRCA